MAKRKYTRSGDKAEAYECTKKSCKWQGTDSEKTKKQVEEGYFEHVCPKCGNDEFYGLLEAPKK